MSLLSHASTAGMSAVQFDRLFIREFERKDGSTLQINQSEVGDVGCVVWDAAMVLAAYLETPVLMKDLVGKRVIELGAGTGLAGLQAACVGANCEITDLADFIPLIKMNIDVNKALIKGSAIARPLSWGEDVEQFFPKPDYILLSDCIYYPDSLTPLVSTITALSDCKTTVLCCYEERTTDNKPKIQKEFFDLMRVHFGERKIPLEEQDSVWQSEDIHIYKFTKR